MKIAEDLIKKGSINRPGSENSCEYITVHETGNRSEGANAKAHASYIKKIKTKTSWHYTVDDSSIYRHIPDCEKSYHTSAKEANERSISVELCVNEDGDFQKTIENAAWLCRELSEKYRIPRENVRRHYDWTGKSCPQTLMKNGWDGFLELCFPSEKREEKVISVSELCDMGYTHIALHG